MSDQSPIIDVNPVASASDAARSGRPSGDDTFRAPSYGKDAAQAAAVNATVKQVDETAEAEMGKLTGGLNIPGL